MKLTSFSFLGRDMGLLSLGVLNRVPSKLVTVEVSGLTEVYLNSSANILSCLHYLNINLVLFLGLIMELKYILNVCKICKWDLLWNGESTIKHAFVIFFQSFTIWSVHCTWCVRMSSVCHWMLQWPVLRCLRKPWIVDR